MLQLAGGPIHRYFYDALGNKRKVVYVQPRYESSYPSPNPGPITSLPYGTTYELKTDYCGNIVYEDDVLSCIRTGEGFIEFSGSGVPTYHYYLRDHQGNNRVVIDQNNNVVQINDYYPFGGIFGDASAQQSKQQYKFGDKEFDRMNALDWLDFSARMYDPVIARFNSPDPLAEKYYSVSPYAYCLNNPVMYVDPDGRAPIKALKAAFNTGRRMYKAYRAGEKVNVVKAVVQEAMNIVDNVTTLFDSEASTFDRVIAGVDLVTGFGSEVSKGAKALGIANDTKHVEKAKDLLQGGDKLPQSKIKKAPSKRGNAPIGEDGKPVELHHRNQTPDGPIDEMTRTDHRGGGNYKSNHSNTGQEKSQIDRGEFQEQRKIYWENEWDNGRFD